MRNFNNFKIILTILTTIMLIGSFHADNIKLDPNFPIMVKNPIRENEVTGIYGQYEIRFKFLPKKSKVGNNLYGGLYYNQFIGIKFTEDIFQFNSVLPGCLLTSGSKTYATESAYHETPAFSNTLSPTNIFYCKFVDSDKQTVPTNEPLILTITFNSQQPTSLWINYVTLFTSTSNNNDQIIIDYVNLGSVGLYSNYFIQNNSIAKIKGNNPLIKISSPSGRSDNTLYPGFTFDIKFSVEIANGWYLDPEDYVFLLTFDTQSFNLPNQINSEKTTDKANGAALSNLLSIVDAENGIIINGFKSGDLYGGRNFFINLIGVKATDLKIEQGSKLSLLVYYRNTYSVVSFSEIEMEVVKRIKILETEVSHPENFYVYDGMAFPFKFGFTIDVDITSGGFVLIRHKNRVYQTNDVSFVSASCNFLTGFENGFGKRWNCYPLRNDFNYSSDVSLGEGSTGNGFFFRMNTIQTSTTLYSLSIWAFINVCKSTTDLYYRTSLLFSINIYKTLDHANNEATAARFSNSIKLANSNSDLEFKDCYHLQTRTDRSLLTTSLSFFQIPKERSSTGSAGTTTTKTDIKLPIGIEVNNIEIITPMDDKNLENYRKQTNFFYTQYNSPTTVTQDKIFGVSTTAQTTPSFLDYGSLTANTSYTKLYLTSDAKDNNFQIVFFVNTDSVTAGDNLTMFYPNECDSNVGNLAAAVPQTINYYTTTNSNGVDWKLKISFVFSTTFLTLDDDTITSPGCQLGWFEHQKTLADNDYSHALKITENKLYTGGTTYASQNNAYKTLLVSADIQPITTDATHIQKKNMSSNTIKNYLTNTTSSNVLLPFKIESDEGLLFDQTGDNLNLIKLTGANCASPNTFGLTVKENYIFIEGSIYSNCLKWKNSFENNYPSIFTYFEVQKLLINKVGDLDHPIRIVRFVKLLPENGVFQKNDVISVDSSIDYSPSSTAAIDVQLQKAVTGHFSVTSPETVPFAVCLIEISGQLLEASKSGRDSNKLLIFLFATSLLDTDEYDVTSQYPVAPVTTGSSRISYGLNSGQTVPINNRLVGDFTFSTVKLPVINPISSGAIVDDTLSVFESLYWNLVAQMKAELGTNSLAVASTIFSHITNGNVMYQYLLGSLVIINTKTSATDSASVNLYIPFLCPSAVDYDKTNGTNYPDNGIYFTAPIVTSVWVNMNNYNSVSSFDKYVKPYSIGSTMEQHINTTENMRYTRIFFPYQFTGNTAVATCAASTISTLYGKNSGTAVEPTSVYLLRSAPFTDTPAVTIKHVNQSFMQDGKTTKKNSLKNLSLKFEPYSSTIADADKYLWLTNKDENDYKTSAILLFLNNTIDTTSSVVTTEIELNTTLKQVSLKNDFFIVGKKFNRFLVTTKTDSNGRIYGNNKLCDVATPNTTLTTLLLGYVTDDVTMDNINLGDTLSIPAQAAYNSSDCVKATSTTSLKSDAIGLVTLTKDSKKYIKGIPRLSIESLFESGNETDGYYIDTYNRIAAFALRNVGTLDSSSAPTIRESQHILSNLIVDSTFSEFVLYNPDVVYDTGSQADWSPLNILLDASEKNIKDDKSSGFILNAQLPSQIPAGSKIKLNINQSFLQSSDTSVCGIITTGSDTFASTIADNCEVSPPNVTCKTKKITNKFSICCYNVSSDSLGKLNVSKADIVIPYDSKHISSWVSTRTGQTYNDIWYTSPASSSMNLAEYSPTTTTPLDIENTTNDFVGKITNFKYKISTSDGGIGLALIHVTLPRPITRGMNLSILADFSKLAISNVKPKIEIVMGQDDIYGSRVNEDLFVDSVYSQLNTSGLELRLKNIVYKCQITFSDSLYISIWPVQTYNLSKQSVSITMKRPSDSLDLVSVVSGTFSTFPIFTTAAKINNVSNDLCKISSSNIEPRIVDEYAKYDVTLDFQQFSSSLENEVATEFILVFPYLYYPEMQSNLDCLINKQKAQCNYIERSMLSVRFNGDLNVSTDAKIVVSIIGIKNPQLLTSNSPYFTCVINNTNFLEETRTTLIKGITNISEGIYPQNDMKFGNIVFKNKYCKHTFAVANNSSFISKNDVEGQEVADEEVLNPREDPPKLKANYSSLHQFGFTIDSANNLIDNWKNGFELTGNPILYITFPPQYRFSYHSFSPSGNITAYTLNTLDNSIMETVNLLSIKSISVVGNQLKISFNESSVKFTNLFQHFIIKLYNLPASEDSTINSNDATITTEAFNFVFTNSSFNYVFRNWTNLNNFSNLDVLINKPNILLAKNKGFKYEFDQKKWVIDSYDKSKQVFNTLAINSGRFNKYVFKVRSSSKNLEPGVVEIVIENTKINFADSKFMVSTYMYSDTSFLIGIKCGENPGFELVKPTFKQNNFEKNVYDKFMPMAPWIIEIKTKDQGLIKFSSSNIVRINGSIFVDFFVSEPPYEDLVVNFQPSNDSLIENGKIISGDLKVRTVFRITNADASNVQSYSLGKPANNCYKFDAPKISFTIDGVAAIIPNNAIQQHMFEYRESQADQTLPDKNSIKFVFSTEFTQIYIYAVLVCINDDFPTDEQMKTQNVTASGRLSYFSEILNIEGSADLIFSELIRGTPYKLKIFIESTQGDRTLRTSSSLVIENYTLTNGTVIPIIATKSVSPLCASYRFKTRPGIQTTNPLLWYWQKKFASGGYYETGCISAVDQYGTEIPGLPFIKNETNCGRSNCRFIDYNSYVVNQTGLDVSETYTICAYPLSTCKNDPIAYEEKFNELINELNTNNTFNSILNVKVVPEFTLSQVSDSNVPTVPVLTNQKVENNQFSFDAVSENTVVCFAKAIDGSAPLSSEFETCDSSCSVINVSNVSGNYKININNGNNANSLTLYAVCYNDMHCSSSRTGVVSLATFNPKSGGTSGNNGNNNGTNSNGNSTNNNNNSNSAGWFSLNMFALLAILLSFFN